uniref:Uncharacterized protein n=1 Tax=Ananas comosus var. bracteatus TaxID=296719 RepID=A0A6V7Q2V6_ANACO|nr:unnamed protein product [Ananas comosus var. bracteatus]
MRTTSFSPPPHLLLLLSLEIILYGGIEGEVKQEVGNLVEKKHLDKKNFVEQEPKVLGCWVPVPERVPESRLATENGAFGFELCEAGYRYCIARAPVLEPGTGTASRGYRYTAICLLDRGSGLRVRSRGTGTLARVPVCSAVADCMCLRGLFGIVTSLFISPHPHEGPFEP